MRLIRAIVLCMPLLIITTPVQAVEFVAEQITISGGHTYRGNLYYREDMWRIEHNNPGSVEVTIVRKDKGLMWLLMSRTKQFATLPFDASKGVTLERSMIHEFRRETIGTEALEGHPTTLFLITVQEGQESFMYYQWLAEDLQLPLRIARKDGPGSWSIDA